MSVQILLQGKILGTEEFLLTGEPREPLFIGRLRWLNLLSEVLPRALIAELGLSKMLLGSSGGEQFLVVLPEEVRPQAEQFLAAARAQIRDLTQGHLELHWAITENLGDWTVVRKRLNEQFQQEHDTPFAATGFVLQNEIPEPDSAYFEELGRDLRDANSVSWSPESPAQVSAGKGKHTWSIIPL
jgi:CRISPR-associated protein Csm1